MLACTVVVGFAKRRGLLKMVQPTLDDLLSHGLRLSTGLYHQILHDAGERSSKP